jgi:hypothetical protein
MADQRRSQEVLGDLVVGQGPLDQLQYFLPLLGQCVARVFNASVPQLCSPPSKPIMIELEMPEELKRILSTTRAEVA